MNASKFLAVAALSAVAALGSVAHADEADASQFAVKFDGGRTRAEVGAGRSEPRGRARRRDAAAAPRGPDRIRVVTGRSRAGCVRRHDDASAGQGNVDAGGPASLNAPTSGAPWHPSSPSTTGSWTTSRS